jgi:hypothetical protein
MNAQKVEPIFVLMTHNSALVSQILSQKIGALGGGIQPVDELAQAVPFIYVMQVGHWHLVRASMRRRGIW